MVEVKRFMCYMCRDSRTDLGPLGQKLVWNQSVPWIAPRTKTLSAEAFCNLSCRPTQLWAHALWALFLKEATFFFLPGLAAIDSEIHSSIGPASGLTCASLSHGVPDHMKDLSPISLLESFSGGSVFLKGRSWDWTPANAPLCPNLFLFIDDISSSCQHCERVKILPILQC